MTAGTQAILSGFRPIIIQPPARQDALLGYSAWLLAAARCAAAQTRSQDSADRIFAETREAVARFGVKPEHLTRRQFCAFPGDERGLGADGGAPELPPVFADLRSSPAGPTIDRRMRDSVIVALEVFRRWYAEQPQAPDHLLHVSCSGYASPSAAQRLASERGWQQTTITHCYHMGCYAAFPAIRTAIGLLAPSVLSAAGRQGRVDIVHTEYLSLHFNPLLREPGNIIDSTLFADGFIGYSAYTEEAFARSSAAGLRVLAHHEALIPRTLDEMSWELGPHQFEMYLSKNVPLAIEQALAGFVQTLCARAGLGLERDKHRILFAIHPGGPKILDHARAALGANESQIRHSRSVFQALGNMSSATIPHVLMRLLADETVPGGTPVVTVAFGPGLTATGLVLETLHPSS